MEDFVEVQAPSPYLLLTVVRNSHVVVVWELMTQVRQSFDKYGWEIPSVAIDCSVNLQSASEQGSSR